MRRKLVGAVVAVTAVLGLGVAAIAAQASNVSAMSLVGTWSVDGRVMATAIVGDKLVVGGTFTSAVAADGTTEPRANLAAFDLATGALLPSFAGGADGAIRAINYNGSRLFVGGSFLTIGGQARSRLAELDPATGATLALTRNAWSTVYTLASSNSTLYIGGSFSNIGGVAATRVAALDLGTNNIKTNFSPTIDNTVQALALSADQTKLFIGGIFTTVGGTAHNFLADINATTGAVNPLLYSVSGEVLGLATSNDPTRVYASLGGSGNQATAVDTTTGARLWRTYFDGDGQAVATYGGDVIMGFHEGYQGDVTRKFWIADEATGTLDTAHNATVAGFMGVFSISVNADYLVLGGEFHTVDGVHHEGFAIFKVTRPTPTTTTTTTTTTTAPTTTTSTTTTSTTAPATTTTALTTTTTAPAGTTTLKPFGSTWKYNDTAATTPDFWTTRTFDDSAWKSGAGPLGTGNGDEATKVANRYNTANLTTWFRSTISLTSVPSGGITLGVVADDGAVVYVNGVEVKRINMPTGVIDNDTKASSWVSGTAEYAVTSFTVPASALVTGINQLAVEVHRVTTTDGDIRFDLQATASGTPTSTTTTTTSSTTTTTAPTTTSTTTTTTAPTTTSTTTTTTAPTTTSTTTTTTVPAPATGAILSPLLSAWRYNDYATSLPTNWAASSYADSGWKIGNATLGIGNNDENTKVANRWNTTNMTTWFRRTITLTGVPTRGATLRLIADDGAVVYINGVERARFNMPAGAVSPSTIASAWITGTAEYTYRAFDIPASAFVSGTNTIAVEIHRAAVSDGDIRFDAELTAK